MKYLYKYNKLNDSFKDGYNDCDLKYKIFTPSLWKGVFITGETKNIKTFGVRLLFQIMTMGKAKIFYVVDNGDVIHTSYVVPKCFKFAFLKKNDYEIGPCFTHPQHRGKGIYPFVLRLICHNMGNNNTMFYMIVDEENTASIKGIEKAGFTKCGNVKVTKFTKRYLPERTL